MERQDRVTTTGSDSGAGVDAIDRGILPELIGYQLRRAQVKVFNSFAEHLDRLGLTPGQFGVLVLIGANPGSSQSALARAVGSSRSLMVRTIDRLEANGMVARRRAPADRRSHAIVLTARGGRMVERLERDVAEHERRMTEPLSADERDTLLRLLRRLNDGASARRRSS